MSFAWPFCFIFFSNAVAVICSEIWAKPTLFWTWICIASVELLRHALPSPKMYYVRHNMEHFIFSWDLIHPPSIIRKNSSYSPLLNLSSHCYVWVALLFFAFTFFTFFSLFFAFFLKQFCYSGKSIPAAKSSC